MTDTKERCKSRILNYLKGKKTVVSDKELYKKTKGQKNPTKPPEFRKAINELIADGSITEAKGGYKLLGEDCFTAEVTRLNKTFGFVKKAEKDAEEIFVPGKFMLGALPGDKVVCRLIESRGELPEAMIVSIAKNADTEFTGKLVRDRGRLYVRSDTLCKDLIELEEQDTDAKEGDKVAAAVTHRGTRHSDHRCRITASFGTSESAYNCAMSVLYTREVETEFPLAVMDEARHIGSMKITDKDIYSRLDLRDEPIFTIDGADTKDIDDAVSVERTDDGYRLGIHIADVSHYVKAGSALDSDAFVRGTSIYYANKVIPMLPKELSNGICSLNPDEDRLAFSCIMEISAEGELKGYKFLKSVIRSRVKGVYDEVNRIIEENKVPDDLREKYGSLFDRIMLMKELAHILNTNRINRGSPQLETSEPKLVIDENEVCVGVKRRTSGVSENIIEEFMLMANTAAAKTAAEKGIPFVYRVHEKPSPEKIARLLETADKLGIPHPEFQNVKPAHLSAILEESKKMGLDTIMNNIVLRSMAKAKYADEPLGHFGLALDDYAHFTSPIRRYPDLAIHRILTEVYNKTPLDKISSKYGKFAFEAAVQSSECEISAMQTERECEGCYMAEYMLAHLGEEFEGVICSAAEFGVYVELDNTIEGLVKTETLGGCEFDGDFSFNKGGKTVYRVGDRVTVKCVKAEVDTGNIDFEMVKNEV